MRVYVNVIRSYRARPFAGYFSRSSKDPAAVALPLHGAPSKVRSRWPAWLSALRVYLFGYARSPHERIRRPASWALYLEQRLSARGAVFLVLAFDSSRATGIGRFPVQFSTPADQPEGRQSRYQPRLGPDSSLLEVKRLFERKRPIVILRRVDIQKAVQFRIYPPQLVLFWTVRF
jgi:hypothetical protein